MLVAMANGISWAMVMFEIASSYHPTVAMLKSQVRWETENRTSTRR
jgi:hypothetical protein